MSPGGALIALTVACTACTTEANAPAPDPSKNLDETVFKCKVEPILARQCSYNACHGNAGAALRVYTPGKLREMRPNNVDEMTAPLTDSEHHGNFTSAAGFAYAAPNPDDNFLLRKPLPASWGGYEHVGGAIWNDTGDPQYKAIHDWLAGTGTCN